MSINGGLTTAKQYRTLLLYSTRSTAEEENNKKKRRNPRVEKEHVVHNTCTTLGETKRYATKLHFEHAVLDPQFRPSIVMK